MTYTITVKMVQLYNIKHSGPKVKTTCLSSARAPNRVAGKNSEGIDPSLCAHS